MLGADVPCMVPCGLLWLSDGVSPLNGVRSCPGTRAAWEGSGSDPAEGPSMHNCPKPLFTKL